MDAAVAPFEVRIAADDVDDLRDRLRRTRWPDAEPVADRSQGVRRDELQPLAAYWADGYEPHRLERRLNAVPQVRVQVGGTTIHALHLPSPDPAAVPLLLTHGWPGSVLEFVDVIRPLTEGSPAFSVVCPSLPGYGFSPAPRTTGWGIERIADTWAALMAVLGCDRFVASGGDWGTSITTQLALRHPERLLGIHLTPPLVAPGPRPWTAAEEEAARLTDAAVDDGAGYTEQQRTRPQTLGYALTDSPVGQLAWILERFQSWVDGDLWQVLTRDQVLDDVSLYWFTRTAASSARLYWESIATVQRWMASPPTEQVRVPTACSVFRDVPRPSRRWAAARFPDIRSWSEPARGGHFAAMEQPALFVEEVRRGFAAILA